MKIFSILLGLCISSMVYAESKSLPPIINNSTYANGAAYSGQAAGNQPMLEMLGRVESLQTEIQQLRGMLEQQSHEINNLKQREQNLYADMNSRLQQLESAAGISVSAPVPVMKPYTAPVKHYKAKATAPAITKQAQAVKQVKPKSKAEEKAAFDKAFASVKNSHYQQAISELEQFLQDYPRGSYSDNAYFWLGSVYKVVNDISAAKKNFQAVYTQFPKSEKASMAMLKLADIYKQENNTSKAQQLYTQISTQYPDSTAAHMATKKLQNIGL
ncbi:tol-pal system protein YbgF [Methyloprofundus sp.]|uniref:tol-pal system protein YbgF n=1 Tax=Methyloprofundus sp. TaxID=2020875 RepID=UPI003D0EE76B